MPVRRAVIWLSYRGRLNPVPVGPLAPIVPVVPVGPVAADPTMFTAVRDVITAVSIQYLQIHNNEMQNVSVEIDGQQRSMKDLEDMSVATYRDRWMPIFISGRHTGIFFKLI